MMLMQGYKGLKS